MDHTTKEIPTYCTHAPLPSTPITSNATKQKLKGRFQTWNEKTTTMFPSSSYLCHYKVLLAPDGETYTNLLPDPLEHICDIMANITNTIKKMKRDPYNRKRYMSSS